MLGDALERGGEHAQAHLAYATSLPIYRRLVAKSGVDRSFQSALAAALVDDGEALFAAGDAAGARKEEMEALPILQHHAAGDAADVDAQRLLAVALSDLARIGGAGVGWTEAVAQWQAIDHQGQLKAEDRHFLTEAIQQAGVAKTP
jgi:hypothetical protein